ncbi:MAG: pantetheine-phosphate adenylyltransferase [Clostridiales bacterium]|jgi:pantetheine-phosphate adenylyltransferase|nr:pantetheine-phosphate adenylyltransferase [Clostridiales bacterium]
MVAVYPGSFDPITLGHLDIIERASKFTDSLLVAILSNSAKRSFFTVEERIEQLKEVIENRGMHNVAVKSFSGLLIDFALENKAGLIIRGLRAVTDFEYEFQMALTNRTLAPALETLLIPTSTQHLYLSSSIVKEIARYGGCIDEMVPPEIKTRLVNKLKLKEE